MIVHITNRLVFNINYSFFRRYRPSVISAFKILAIYIYTKQPPAVPRQTLTRIKGKVIPTAKFASQFNIPEKLIAAGLGPCLNNSPPRNSGIGPNKVFKT